MISNILLTIIAFFLFSLTLVLWKILEKADECLKTARYALTEARHVFKTFKGVPPWQK